MKRTELKRTTPLKRKSATKKRRVTGCTVRSCKRRGPFTEIPPPATPGVDVMWVKTARLCKFHLGQEADRTWSKVVRLRDGRCMAAEMFPQVECWGALQAMHIIPRSYRATRLMVANGRAGCAAHHKFLTEHPLEHWDWAESVTNPQNWGVADLRRAALHGKPGDTSLVLVALRSDLAQLGAALDSVKLDGKALR